VLFVGWLEQDKGVFELIEACARLAAECRFALHFVGDGRSQREASALVSRYNLEGVVHFCGWLEGRDLQRELAEADIFVLPSWGEGLPNAMIEAMAARLPVIATRVGAIPEVLSDGVSGLLIPTKDVTALSDALRGLLGSAALRHRLGREAHAIAARDFSAEAAANRIESLIRQVVGVADEGVDPVRPT
jgi:glycosyltransferase involved in cell wall biosynthesis